MTLINEASQPRHAVADSSTPDTRRQARPVRAPGERLASFPAEVLSPNRTPPWQAGRPE